MITYLKILDKDIKFEVMCNALPTKGNLVYEYNPFRNYRLSEDKFWYKNGYYTKEELENEYKIIYLEETDSWKKEDKVLTSADEIPELHEKGELVDFITDELSFSLDHPVHIVPQYSYDGSVNLIINDGINTPRMINSRFSATGKNTYEIIDRKGNNDTNIYDSGELFFIDTSLYKTITKIPKIQFNRVTYGGNLKVGNYYFYFKLADEDGNETDFVGESGLVSIFIGANDPYSITTGQKNENSLKLVEFLISNIDSAYSNIYVYYSRSTSELNELSVIEYVKIDLKYLVDNFGISNLIITGFENTINVTAADINLNYNVVDAACTSTTCQNMLFLGNVHKPDIPYKELEDLSLRFLPYLKEEEYPLVMDLEYIISSKNIGYYDPKFIYDKTGYWADEIYRFGVVYIMPNDELSPVFNIRGGNNISIFENVKFTDIPVFDEKTNERVFINYNELSYEILEVNDSENKVLFENTKGVCKFTATKDNDTIYGLDIRVDKDTINELKKYVKGYFFVRQTRIPTILALGITIGIDKESRTPCLPTVGGVIDEMDLTNLDKTYLEADLDALNYISEGFLNRYSFSLKPKGGFIKLFSGILNIFASVLSFFPVWGLVASMIISGASFILTSAVTGKFNTAAFVSTVAQAALPGAFKALNSIKTIKAVKNIKKVADVINTISLTGKTAAVAVANIVAPTVQGILGVKDFTEGSYNIVTGALNSRKYNGRDTVIPDGYKKVENEDSRLIGGEFVKRIIIKGKENVDVSALLCPDYTVNQPYFNLIFTGNSHILKQISCLSVNITQKVTGNYLDSKYRHFYHKAYKDYNILDQFITYIIAVPDNVKAIGLKDKLFRSRAGEAEEAWRYLEVGKKYETSTELLENSDIIRGAFSPYLALSNTKLPPATIVNIMIPEYSDSNVYKYFYIRMVDNSPFKSISNRYDINDLREQFVNQSIIKSDDELGYKYELFRGDCYLCLFTQRLNRNFNDPSAPYNDKIVNLNTWKESYTPENTEKYAEINLGDVNAAQLGMWVTFKLRSSNNLNIRTLDGSSVDECAMQGHDKGFFPYHPMSVEGTYKHADSYIHNKGFSVSLGERWNALVPDVPHIKNWFGTRIMYSDIHINDAYKNGYRVFLGTHYRDYTREYGEIVKLVPFESSLLCVFEHGIGLIPVNERAVAGLGAGGNVYINTSNVLPENPKILSDMFGSQWPESVLKVPGISGDSPLYVYGVDTIAKKIWRTDGTRLECISDFKVQEFLNNNITLGERELTPKIGIRNVKTVYNAFKRDVMFTFYDNTYGFEEKVWNLCWNELLQKFTTFYSWVPSYMENINNIPFSFDRNVSKWIAKLGVSHTESSFADGITLSNVILTNYNIRNVTDPSAIYVSNLKYPFKYKTKTGEDKVIYLEVPKEKLSNLVGVLSLSNRVVPDVFHTIKYNIERDNYGNYKHFTIDTVDEIDLNPSSNTYSDSKYTGKVIIYGLYFTLQDSEKRVPVYYKNDEDLQVVRYMSNSGDKTELLNVMMDSERHDPESLLAELYYRNGAGNVYADVDSNKLGRLALECKSKAGTWIKDRDTISKLYNKLDAGSDPKTIKIGFCKYLTDANGNIIYDDKTGDAVPAGKVTQCTDLSKIENLIDTVNGLPYVHGIPLNWHWTMTDLNTEVDTIHFGLPIFKDLSGKRLQLPKKEQLNSDKLVTLLNIKATISIPDEVNAASVSDTYYNSKAPYALGTNLIDAGYYESTIAIAPEWNLLFLTSDFWKHGQAGIIDITDPIKPTYWYGKLHPFEFEFLVVNDPSVHKIFDNLEIVANKAKPESFHYEIVGECYDFAKDKVNIYFRQEAIKALWLYNGADLCYDRNFLKVLPKQQPRSADLIRTYYARQDKINEVEDYYVQKDYPEESKYDYRHLTGAEIVYYPNRNEYRIWNHALAVDLDELSQDDARSIIGANCQYLEDKWRVQINPILICYKNEYTNLRPSYLNGFALLTPTNSSWHDPNRPPLPVVNSPIPSLALSVIKNNHGEVLIPKLLSDMGYSSKEDSNGNVVNMGIDTSSWLNANNIYVTSFGEAQNRKELDLKDKFIKIRIRYSGKDLAIINFINTIYRVSFS